MFAQIRRLAFPLLFACTLGCTQQVSGPSAEGQAFLLSAEPQNPQGVVELKTALTSEQPPTDEMIVVGRVGSGQNEAFDREQATFLLRDLDLEIKSHDHDGNHDNCKFCQAAKAKRLQSMALVRVVDENGNVVQSDAQRLLGLKEDLVVVAQGKGTVDEVGTFVFDAAKVFIRPN